MKSWKGVKGLETIRPYRSDLRAEQARATRRAVVDAASQLFVARGYAGTTIDAVADKAGVSRKTVFTAVGGKPMLLKLAWDWALVGDDEPVDMASRPELAELQAQSDPPVLVRQWAHFIAPIASRLAGLDQVLADAGRSDPEIADLYAESERNRRGGALSFVTRLQAVGGLREGVTVDRAADVVEVLMDPMPYQRLVRGAGWTDEEYADWLQVCVTATLLPR
ncbi:MAG: TetR/AcrR family transcriptional regulator [Candidatus Nanopelagicales bacterium]